MWHSYTPGPLALTFVEFSQFNAWVGLKAREHFGHSGGKKWHNSLIARYAQRQWVSFTAGTFLVSKLNQPKDEVLVPPALPCSSTGCIENLQSLQGFQKKSFFLPACPCGLIGSWPKILLKGCKQKQGCCSVTAARPHYTSRYWSGSTQDYSRWLHVLARETRHSSPFSFTPLTVAWPDAFDMCV